MPNTVKARLIKLQGITIFVLFFGVSALEAFQTRNRIRAASWLAIGAVFLIADNLRKTP